MSSEPASSAWAPRLAVATIAMACLWPFLWVLPLGPMSRDATIWMARSRFLSRTFIEWTVFTQHFKVGYRPVTSLSYAVNDWLGGYRLTDLLLHAACVGLVYVLYRRLAPQLSRWGGVVASLVMAAHPMAELVVPHLARRGYSLATALSLAGLALLTARSRLRLLGPLLLGGAALANDASYVTFVVGAGMLWWLRDRDRDGLIVLGSVLAGLLVERFWVIGGVGGYRVDDRAANLLPIVGSTWDRLGALTGPLDLPLGYPRAALATALLGSMLGLTVWGLRHARQRWGDAAAVPMAWMLGFTVLFAPQGVWFPRQVYLLVAPLAVWVGLLVGQAEAGDRPSLKRALPALCVLLGVLARSPMVHGTNEVQRIAWTRTDAIVEQLVADIADVRAKQPVYLVLPFYKRPGQGGFRARDARGDDDGSDDESGKRDPLGARIVEQRVQLRTGRLRTLTTAALLFADPTEPAPYGEVGRDDEGWWVRASPTTRLSVYQGERLSDEENGGHGRLQVDGWLWVHDGVSARLERVR